MWLRKQGGIKAEDLAKKARDDFDERIKILPIIASKGYKKLYSVNPY